ncbi:hypothetical protein BTVI_147039 [Pitangus sulphuratus]|nr:hypothetical protein BTVI_147039 [Pitangus sulphuratus]
MPVPVPPGRAARPPADRAGAAAGRPGQRPGGAELHDGVAQQRRAGERELRLGRLLGNVMWNLCVDNMEEIIDDFVEKYFSPLGGIFCHWDKVEHLFLLTGSLSWVPIATAVNFVLLFQNRLLVLLSLICVPLSLTGFTLGCQGIEFVSRVPRCNLGELQTEDQGRVSDPDDFVPPVPPPSYFAACNSDPPQMSPRTLACDGLSLPNVYATRINGAEVFFRVDPPPSYEDVQNSNTSEQGGALQVSAMKCVDLAEESAGQDSQGDSTCPGGHVTESLRVTYAIDGVPESCEDPTI